MNLSELCFHLRWRRQMYLPDDRFITVVAFVEGFNSALDGVPLADFNSFVALATVGHTSPLHWSHLIASTGVSIPGGETSLKEIPSEADAGLIETLLELLEEYQTANPPRGAALA